MLRTGVLFLSGLLMFTACGPDRSADDPLKMPKKEETWVKTERVDSTREDALAPKSGSGINIPVNQDLRDRLLTTRAAAPKSPVKDTDSCLALLAPLDKDRMASQREGGAWSLFEKFEVVRSYSDTGMQIDSHLNKLVFSLRHLCETAQGVPLNSLATKVNETVNRMGKEKAREHFIEVVGEAPKDVDLWLEYAEFAKNNASRKVPYPEIQELILKTRPLVDFYKELVSRQVDESGKDAFLSDSVTLLNAIQDRLANEPRVVMALKEDVEPPLATRWEM